MMRRNLLLRIFYMNHPIDRIIYTTAFVTLVVKHWLEQDIVVDIIKTVKSTPKNNNILNIVMNSTYF